MKNPCTRGFTLIEMLLTLAVASVLTMLAVPSFQSLMSKQQATDSYNRVASALHLARSIAVMKNTTSIVCPSTDGRHCSPSQHWQNGWLVAIDSDENQQPDGTPSQVFTATSDSIRIYTSQGRQNIRFQSDGSSPGSNLSMIICHSGRPQSARSVVLSNVGRIRHGEASTAQAAACSGS